MMHEVMLMRAHYWDRRFETTRTTVALPTSLLERVNAAIDSGMLPNRNVAIAAALEAYLDEIERQEIDRQFAAMSEDLPYRQLNEELTEAFADADWQALLSGEAEQGRGK
jgi:metal-responsive CopG/Arc/MetJ family transcriptional regulator